MRILVQDLICKENNILRILRTCYGSVASTGWLRIRQQCCLRNEPMSSECLRTSQDLDLALIPFCFCKKWMALRVSARRLSIGFLQGRYLQSILPFISPPKKSRVTASASDIFYRDTWPWYLRALRLCSLGNYIFSEFWEITWKVLSSN